LSGVESSGGRNPKAFIGNNYGEYGGKYQYTTKTWNTASAKYAQKAGLGNEPLPMKQYEDAVTKNEVLGYVNQGYSPKQIASIWNSGHPDWDGRKGYNKKSGEYYDTPAHVAKFERAYNGQAPHEPERAQESFFDKLTKVISPTSAEAAETEPETGPTFTQSDEDILPFVEKKTGMAGAGSKFRTGRSEQGIQGIREVKPEDVEYLPGMSPQEREAASPQGGEPTPPAKDALPYGFKNYTPPAEETGDKKATSDAEALRRREELGPPVKAKNTWEYITKTIPHSVRALVEGTQQMPGAIIASAAEGYRQAVKQQDTASKELHGMLDKTTPLTPKEITRAKELMDQSLQIPVVEGFKKAGSETVKGLVQFQVAPTGLMGWEEFKTAWYERPVESLAAILPFASKFLGMKGVEAPTDIQAKALVDTSLEHPTAPAAQEFIKAADLELRQIPQDPVGPPVADLKVGAEPPATLKQPWEMTRDEFNDEFWFNGRGTTHPFYDKPEIVGGITKNIDEARGFARIQQNQPGQSLPTDSPGEIRLVRGSDLNPEEYEGLERGRVSSLGFKSGVTSDISIPGDVKDAHHFMVEKAISEGKPVPSEVLKDYPALEKQTQPILMHSMGGPDTGPFLKKSATEIKETVQDVPGKVKHAATVIADASKRVWDWYKRPAPPWTEFKDTLGKYLGARNVESYENWEFTRSIVDAVPDKVKQEAITNWLQADGDKDVLAERATKSQGKLKDGYDASLNLTPEEIQVAEKMRAYYDRMAKEAIDAGVMDHAIDNYVTQIWSKENPVSQKLRSDTNAGLLNTNFQFARKRIFDSYFDGEQAGYNPKNKSVAYLAAQYHQSMYEAIAARRFIKELSECNAEDGRPITAVSGGGNTIGPKGTAEAYLIRPRTQAAETFDYRVIDHPALRDWKWVAKDGEGKPIFLQGDMRIHPDHYAHLKNVLGKSAIRENTIGRSVLTGVQNFKSTLLSLSGFHQVQEGIHAIFHKVNPATAPKIDFNVPLQRELVDHGLMIADHDALGQFSEGLTSSGLINKLPVIGEISQKYGEYLFKDYIPRLKMAMATHAFERNVARYGDKLSRDQILEMTAKQGDAAFGELNTKMMGRNKTVGDVLRLVALAPDFLEARLKFVGQALKPGGKEQATALIRGAAGMYLAGVIGNEILNGDPHWDKPFTLVVHGKDYALRSVPGDIVHLITDPRSFVYHRLNPSIVKPLIEYLTGRDQFGRRRDMGEQIKDYFTGAVPIPAQGLFNKKEHTLMDTILGSLGVSSWKSKSKAERLMADLQHSETHMDLSPKDRAKAARRYQLMDLWDDGKKDRFKAELNTALADKILTHEDAVKMKKELKLAPFPRGFKRVPLGVGIHVYNVATPEEKKVLRPLLKKKFAAAHPETRKQLRPDYKAAVGDQ
jgi:preprotein translocase subunit Sss1